VKLALPISNTCTRYCLNRAIASTSLA